MSTKDDIKNGIKEENEHLESVRFEKQITNPLFIKPLRMVFERRGLKLQWELAFEGDSANAIIYHVDRKQLLCVKQFRPAVFARKIMRLEENKEKKLEEIDFTKYPLSYGMTLELCGGLLDKPKLSPKEVMIEEIFEELGFRAKPENMEFIQIVTGIGVSGSQQHLFFATVSESDEVKDGGGGILNEGEIISNVYLDIDKLDQALKGPEAFPSTFSFGIYWFLAHKKDLYS